MEDNQRPFTPMIDRDPPTPEPSDARKGHKGGVRTQMTAAPSTDSSNIPESSAVAPSSKGKDKSAKEAGKATSKDGQTGNKIKGARTSIKSNLTAESLTEEKEAENEQSFFADGVNVADAPRGDSESSVRSPPSIMTDVGYVPFTVEPDTGSIAVGASQRVKIKFAPLDVNDYQARLTCW